MKASFKFEFNIHPTLLFFYNITFSINYKFILWELNVLNVLEKVETFTFSHVEH